MKCKGSDVAENYAIVFSETVLQFVLNLRNHELLLKRDGYIQACVLSHLFLSLFK